MSQLKFGNSDDKNVLSNGILCVCYRYADELCAEIVCFVSNIGSVNSVQLKEGEWECVLATLAEFIWKFW